VKPSDLDDPTPVEPDATALARVHARSDTFRRRRRTQHWVSAGAAAVIVVLAVAVALAVGGGDSGKPTGPPASSTTIVPNITITDFRGEWRPVAIAGYAGLLTSPPLRDVPYVRFESDHLDGNDGCNGFNGDFELGAGGSFRQTSFFSYAVGCRSIPPLQDALGNARSLELDSGHLVLLSADGRQLAELVHPTVTARIELPSDTMVAGTDMKGHLVVDNETGHVIKAEGCGSLFAVALSNADYQPDIAWTTCLEELDVPTGESTYPVSVSASTNSCTNGPPSDGIPTCSPPNTPPPLAPGSYEARLYQSAHVVPDPPPIPIHVVATS